MKGNGYEAQQTSKEQTKLAIFFLEVPRLCTILGFAHSYSINDYKIAELLGTLSLVNKCG